MLGSVSGIERTGPFRSRSSVRTDLCGLGIKAGLFRQMGAKYALRRYSEENYQEVLGLIKRAHQLELPITKIEVRRPGAVREGDFSDISDSAIRTRAIEGTLKIASLAKSDSSPQTNQVGNLADALQTAQEELKSLAENPSSTLDEVFPVLKDIINFIQIRNISVYVPVTKDTWARLFCSCPWPQDGITKYAPPDGQVPTTTLASIISAPGDFFRVDIGVKPEESPEEAHVRIENEFKAQGIVPDWTSIDNDRERSHGDGRLLFFKIRSVSGSRTLGVFQAHNLVADGETAFPLFENPQDEGRIIAILRAIFDKAAVTIDKIRERSAQEKTKATAANIPATEIKSSSIPATVQEASLFPVFKGTQNRFLMTVLVFLNRIRGLFIETILQRLVNIVNPPKNCKLVEFYNTKNGKKKRIKAYIDYPENVSDRSKSPWVIIPPAFGKTKETTFLLALYLKRNGIGVLRYDDTSAIGESEGDIYDLTLSESTSNISAAIDYLATTEGASNIGLVPFSLSARPAVKATANDSRIKFLIPIVGSPNIQTLLERVYGEDLIADYKKGERKGALNLLGHPVNSDTFLGDAVNAGFGDRTSTEADLQKIGVPIVWFCGTEDPWVEPQEVAKVLGESPKRKVVRYKGISHRVREAGLAPALFAETVKTILSLVERKTISDTDIVHPHTQEIVAKSVRERQRLSRKKLSKDEEVGLWRNYLEGFDILLETRDYMEYLEDLSDFIGLNPGEKMLDAGCGTGNLLIYIMSRLALQKKYDSNWANSSFVGVDFVQEALQNTEKKIETVRKKRKNLPTTTVQRVDLNNGPLPFGEEGFDKIVSSLLLSYVKDPKAVVRKLCGSLKPGGKIILTSLKPDADISQIYHRFMQKIKTTHSKDPHQQELLERGRGLINAAAGWIEVEEEKGTFKYFSEDELVSFLEAEGIKITKRVLSFGKQAIVVVGT